MAKLSLETILKGGKKSAKCPVAGCSAMWSMETATIDTDLKYRMERFYRIQSQLKDSRSQYSDATELVDDDSNR